jgi:hypothetical protein
VTSLTYFVQSFAWSVAGGLVGYMVGVNLRRSTEGADVAGQSRRWRPKFEHFISVVVVSLGVLTAVQGYMFSQRTDQLSRCQLAYTTGFADAIDARTQASKEKDEAQDELWRIIRSGFQAPGPDVRERFEKQLNLYLDAREKVKESQQANPYPPAPRDLCPESAR